MRFHFIVQSVEAVYGTNPCLCWEPYRKHKYSLRIKYSFMPKQFAHTSNHSLHRKSEYEQYFSLTQKWNLLTFDLYVSVIDYNGSTHQKELMARTTQKGNELNVFEYYIFINTNSHPATGLRSSVYLRCHVSETCLAHKIQHTLGVYSM